MGESKLTVTYGPDELEISSKSAKNVKELRDQVFKVLSIPAEANVQIVHEDGAVEDVKDEEKTAIKPTDKAVNFVKPSGSKN